METIIKRAIYVLAAGFLFGGSANMVSAQNPNEEILFFQKQDQVGGDVLAGCFYTVPDKHVFHLTDVIVTTGTVNDTELLRANVFMNNQASGSPDDPFNLPLWIEAPRRNAIVNLSTGAEFVAGEVLCVAAGGDGPDAAGMRVDFFLQGIQTKK